MTANPVSTSTMSSFLLFHHPFHALLEFLQWDPGIIHHLITDIRRGSRWWFDSTINQIRIVLGKVFSCVYFFLDVLAQIRLQGFIEKLIDQFLIIQFTAYFTCFKLLTKPMFKCRRIPDRSIDRTVIGGVNPKKMVPECQGVRSMVTARFADEILCRVKERTQRMDQSHFHDPVEVHHDTNVCMKTVTF